MSELSDLYYALLQAWNRQDAAGYAALFTEDGYAVGFDGSEMSGREEIERSLSEIFADHETGRYVAKIRDERDATHNMGMLRAIAGLVPAGRSDLSPELNAIQTLVAERQDGTWRIMQFQNTPAQLHGRPQAAEALTKELRTLV